MEEFNRVLSRENSAYLFVSGVLAPITSKDEVDEVEKAIASRDKYAGVRTHMQTALGLLTDRKILTIETLSKRALVLLSHLLKSWLGMIRQHWAKRSRHLRLNMACIQVWNRHSWPCTVIPVMPVVSGTVCLMVTSLAPKQMLDSCSFAALHSLILLLIAWRINRSLWAVIVIGAWIVDIK